jgi:hypothetical protein
MRLNGQYVAGKVDMQYTWHTWRCLTRMYLQVDLIQDPVPGPA